MRIEKVNGVSRLLRPDQKMVRASKDATGGIRLTIGEEVAILSPQKSVELATGILAAMGYAIEKKAPDGMPN